MKTVVFHSYKGGVGRSMALLNFAAALARQNKRVVVLDLDVDAPGLPHKLRRKNFKVRGGYVDYLAQFRDAGLRGEHGVLSNRPSAATIQDRVDYLKTFTHLVEFDHGNFNFILIPAGSTTQDYWRQLAAPWFSERFGVSPNEYTADGALAPHLHRNFFEEELQVISKLSGDGDLVDFFIVDCKSGREYASVPLYYWSDVVVSMFPTNPEGLNGAIMMDEAISRVSNSLGRPIQVIPVACRVHPDHDFSQKLAEYAPILSSRSSACDNNVRKMVHKEYIDEINSLKTYGIVLAIPDIVDVSGDEHYALGVVEENEHGAPLSAFQTQILYAHAHLFRTIELTLLLEDANFVSGLPPMAAEQGGLSTKEVLTGGKQNPECRKWADLIARDRDPRVEIIMTSPSAGHLLNSDESRNVALRSITLAIIFSNFTRAMIENNNNTLDDNILSQIFKSGQTVGGSFGKQIIDTSKVGANTISNNFIILVNEWCLYDSVKAGFGHMMPEIRLDKAFISGEIKWKDCFLFSRTELADDQARCAAAFLAGYISGVLERLARLSGHLADEESSNTQPLFNVCCANLSTHESDGALRFEFVATSAIPMTL